MTMASSIVFLSDYRIYFSKYRMLLDIIFKRKFLLKLLLYHDITKV